ncbi:hypothetical protein [Bradyrhizobium sp. LHD-71]|uniref:hypothetical protein n=1 Tax=Bradyrhizobium sp. LHD-71 TaxID=3072141 RepID=UPI00280F7E65|nr:hypothetical protein [Bradyrhizobium sp. LHD-71]MDQ8729597.1 hypothetical protein [Bradyrhizobium sp. LHD-71]
MRLKALIAAAALVLVTPALAHAPKSKHGGRIVLAGAFHVEMVAANGGVDVHLLDHNDKPVAVKGYKGVAILAVEGKSQRIMLEPVGDLRLSGKAAVALPNQPKGVIQIIPPDGKAVSAKFD